MIIRSTPGRSVISIRWCDRNFLRVWRLCARRKPSIVAGEVRRCQDHLAEPSARHLADLAALHDCFHVVEDEIHGLVAPRENGVVDESIDPSGDGGFELHDDSAGNEP
jgi:hypothetical protein